MPPLLSVDKIAAGYGKAQVLFDISLTVNDGELVVLIGGNGTGKTTLLKTISGLLQPVSGVIEFAGRRIDGQLPHEIVKRGISHCPEGRKLFPESTVLENLKAGGYILPYGQEAALLRRVYEYFPILKERKAQKAKTLSGGEEQMLAIGRALMSDPKCLLLDEFSLGLAPLVVQKVARIINTLHQEGISILLVEQNAKLALEMADRGYVMKTGHIFLEGPAKDLRENAEVRKGYMGL